MKINIHTNTDGIQTVEAQKLKVKRQGKLKLYIHKTWKTNMRNAYSVVEHTSGLAICQEFSKRECVRITEDRLKQYPKKKWLQIIRKGVKKYSIPYPLNK